MTAAERIASTERAHAELAAAFHARRCRCGAQAIVVIPGTEAVREMGMLLKRAIPDRNLCSRHAGLISQEEAA